MGSLYLNMTILNHYNVVRMSNSTRTDHDHDQCLPFVSAEMAFWIMASFSGSMLAVASSRITIFAFFSMALAMEIRCFSPPGRIPASLRRRWYHILYPASG